VPITDSFREQLQRRQQYLEVELPPTTLRPLVSDLNCLERILQELLTNACKYSPSGAKIVVSFSTQADQFVLKVSNFGVELATEQSHRIFDKFYRIPNGDPWKQGGTGLGLALVKRLVENIGSSISVTSGANHTCFTVKLKSLAIARSC
jgi:signal transduction histidine kinase